MSAQVDCFSNVIGLSRTDCECFDDDKPTDFDVSQSSLYLDEVEGLSLKYPQSAADCAKGNLWELMQRAAEEGTKAFRSDMMNAIGVNTVRRRKNFSGVVGDDSFSTQFQPDRDFAGVTWKNPIVRSGTMKLRRIGLMFNSSVQFNLFLYNNRLTQSPDDLLASFAVESVANKLTWFEIPNGGIELPLGTDMQYPNQYWLIYDTATSPIPKDTQLTCGCGQLGQRNVWGSNKYSNIDPPAAKTNWLDWMLIAGTQGDFITKRDKNWTHESLSMGLLLDCEFVCKADELLCVDSLDFVNDDLPMVMAYAIRYKAAELLIEYILSSPNLNRFTMLDRERLWGKRNHYRKECQDRILFLVDEYTDPAKGRLNELSDCLMCRNKHGFSKGTIRITD